MRAEFRPQDPKRESTGRLSGHTGAILRPPGGREWWGATFCPSKRKKRNLGEREGRTALKHASEREAKAVLNCPWVRSRSGFCCADSRLQVVLWPRPRLA